MSAASHYRRRFAITFSFMPPTKERVKIETSQDYHTAYVSDEPDLPEKNLIAATLAHAIREAFTGGREVRQAAKEWIRADALRPFSFIWCCGVLNLDYEVIRIRALTIKPDWFRTHRFRG